MNTKKYLSIAIVLISFIVGIFLYPVMPDLMASHWNINSQVDGYMPKCWGLFLMPAVSAAMFILFLVLPKIEPRKNNLEKFQQHFDNFIIIILSFLFYIHALTLLWNLGLRFPMGTFLVPAFGILFFYCGVLVENAKPNWFIGIRTPWTLSSDSVWYKTHKLGGKMFKLVGLLCFLGIAFPVYAFFFVLVPSIFIAIYTIVYSYVEYKKETPSQFAKK